MVAFQREKDIGFVVAWLQLDNFFSIHVMVNVVGGYAREHNAEKVIGYDF